MVRPPSWRVFKFLGRKTSFYLVDAPRRTGKKEPLARAIILGRTRLELRQLIAPLPGTPSGDTGEQGRKQRGKPAKENREGTRKGGRKDETMEFNETRTAAREERVFA